MNTSISSGSLSASTLIFTGKSLLVGACIGADGTNPATVTIYDNTSATGTILWQTVIPATGRNQTILFPLPIQAKTGLYVAISGTGASAIVYRG